MSDFEFKNDLFFVGRNRKFLTEETWDYTGYSDHPQMGWTQMGWNQTLHTKINQISAQIHKATLRGGANTIKINPTLAELILSSEFFRNTPNGDFIAGRYLIVYSEDVPKDEMYVYLDDTNNGLPNTHLMIPEITERNIETNEMAQITFKLVVKASLTEDELAEFESKRIGKIKILNFFENEQNG